MKQIIFLTVLSLGSYGIFAQDAGKKVIVDENGRVYINKALGIYLWISSSPDESAKKVRLKSDSSARFTNPMYFDTEGYNTVRSPSAVDTNTRKTVFPERDIVFEVYADGAAPSSVAEVKSSATKILSGKRYYAKNTKLTITAKDEVSGIERTFYSTNNQPLIEYKAPLSFSGEGEYTVQYFSTDKVGNKENPNEIKFSTDISPPVVSYQIEEPYKNKFVAKANKINISAKDNKVGVKAIYYKINNGAPQLYKSPIPVSVLGSTSGIISIWATDKLNNKSSVIKIGGKETGLGSVSGSNTDQVEKEFYIDNEAPEINVSVDGAYTSGKYTYVAMASKINVNANDNKSGVGHINYSINNKKVDNSYNKPIEFTNDGIAYVRINATDQVGNKSNTILKTFFVDNKPPKSKASVGSPKHKVKDTLYVSGKTKINLTALDKASGTKQIMYSINKGGELKYTRAFNIELEGMVLINYWSVDNVGNKEKIKEMSVFIDTIAPDIYTHFSTTKIGSKEVREEAYDIYPTNALLYVAATDRRAGGEKVTYRINNGPVLSANPISSLTPGNYEVLVIARDILGNKKTETVKFSIEK